MPEQTATASTTASLSRTPLCTYCGTDENGAFEVISRHRISIGATVWLRCSCGALQVRVVRGVTDEGARIVARGRPA